MEKKYIGLLLGIILLIMPVTAGVTTKRLNATEWNLCINANAGGGITYCYIGEKTNALDGLDQYDVCHPPFFPPGRAFIFCQETSFPEPYTNLLYEYKHHSGYKVFNFTSFYYPSGATGAYITLSWARQTLQSSGYRYVYLMLNGQIILDMKNIETYIFWSNPYQFLQFKITCTNMPLSIIVNK